MCWRRPGDQTGVGAAIIAAEAVTRTVRVSHSRGPAVGPLAPTLSGRPGPRCRTLRVIYEVCEAGGAEEAD